VQLLTHGTLLCAAVPGNSGNDKPYAGVKGAKIYGTIVKLNLSNNHIHADGVKVSAFVSCAPAPTPFVSSVLLSVHDYR
jgi:hypothetical protein